MDKWGKWNCPSLPTCSALILSSLVTYMQCIVDLPISYSWTKLYPHGYDVYNDEISCIVKDNPLDSMIWRLVLQKVNVAIIYAAVFMKPLAGKKTICLRLGYTQRKFLQNLSFVVYTYCWRINGSEIFLCSKVSVLKL